MPLSRLVLLLALAVTTPRPGSAQEPSPYLVATQPKLLRDWAIKYYPPLPEAMDDGPPPSEALVALGKELFHDPRLSSDKTVSCASCHQLDAAHGGGDGEVTSAGVGRQRGERNSPSVLNAGFQPMLFWDGRAPTLEAQAREPLLNPVEMGNPDEKAAVESIRGDARYRELFLEAFPRDPDPTFEKITAGLAAFQRTLVTPSRFDDFLRGDDEALTLEERQGLEVFLTVGCRSCHLGVLGGGETFQKLGVIEPYPHTDPADTGRMKITGREEDRYLFKVAPLRNVALTAPYFHDGSAKTLEEAVAAMAKYQVGLELSQREIRGIAIFLESLTGKELEQDRAGTATDAP